MKAGRKNLRKAYNESAVSLGEGESVMRVVSLRGSNLIEVLDAKGVQSLALFPAKFQRSFWIRTGSFVVVDESGREQALESGSKVACVVSQVLSPNQVRSLEKSSEWPSVFTCRMKRDECAAIAESTRNGHDENCLLNSDNSDNEYGDLPPLEENMNRNRPFELHPDSDSPDDSDSEPVE